MDETEEDLQMLEEEQRKFEAQQAEAARITASNRESELRADHIAHIAAANHSYFRKAAVEKDAELRATGLAEVRGTLGSLENVQEKADTLRSEFDGSLLEVEELKLSIARIRELVPEGNPMSPVLATKIKAIEQRQRGIEDGMGALFQKSKEAIGLAESLKDYDQGRTRKLLLHKTEIISLKSKIDGANLSIVPLSMYVKRGFIKIELGLGKGKRKFEKKETIKKKDLEREIEELEQKLLNKLSESQEGGDYIKRLAKRLAIETVLLKKSLCYYTNYDKVNKTSIKTESVKTFSGQNV